MREAFWRTVHKKRSATKHSDPVLKPNTNYPGIFWKYATLCAPHSITTNEKTTAETQTTQWPRGGRTKKISWIRIHSFEDDINVKAGKLRWKNLLDVYDHDQSLDAKLKLAPKLSFRALHPGDDKQNVPYALAIFHSTTSAAIRDYFPENEDAASFLQLIDTWWTVVNSKQIKNTNNRLGNAAVKGDLLI